MASQAETLVLRMLTITLTLSRLVSADGSWPTRRMDSSHCRAGHLGTQTITHNRRQRPAAPPARARAPPRKVSDTHRRVGQLHEPGNETLLRLRLGLRLNHVADRLVERVRLSSRPPATTATASPLAPAPASERRRPARRRGRRRGRCPHLVRPQVANDAGHVLDDLVNKQRQLAQLERHKLPPTLLCDLDEGVASHVLHA